MKGEEDDAKEERSDENKMTRQSENSYAYFWIWF